MKLSFTPAPGAMVRITTKDGQTLTNKDVASVEFEPYFSNANSPGKATIVQVKTEQGTLIEVFELVASGKTGKTTQRTTQINTGKPSAVPFVDRKHKPAEERT